MSTTIGTGYATTADGRQITYEEARDLDLATLEALRPGETFVAYMPSNVDQPSWAIGTYTTLSTWPGLELPPLRIRYWRSRISPSCPDGYRFRSLDGRFYGTSPGPGMYAIVRRGKVGA